MNKLFAIIAIIVGHLLLNLLLPWWNIALASFLVVVLFNLKKVSSWFIPAISIMSLWLVQIFLLDKKTGFRSSERIADLFDAPGFVSYLVPIISAGLIAGLSGYLACLLFGRKEKLEDSENKDSMTIEEYKDNTPGLQDKGII